MTAFTYGMFVWRELSTSDVDGALRFYAQLAGWTSKRVEMPNGAYFLLHKGERQVGGLMALADGVDMPPYWMSYLSVPEVDLAVDAAKRFGGEVVWGPLDVENIGRMATVVDPRGGAFSMMKAVNYSEVVGWRTIAAPSGELETFGFGPGPGEQAATLVKVGGAQPLGWMTFIVVDALGPACERTVKLGGKVLSAQTEVPGIGAYAVVRDPQGAVLGLFKG